MKQNIQTKIQYLRIQTGPIAALRKLLSTSNNAKTTLPPKYLPNNVVLHDFSSDGNIYQTHMDGGVLEYALNCSSDGILILSVTNHQLNIEFLNERLLSILNLPREEHYNNLESIGDWDILCKELLELACQPSQVSCNLHELT